MSYRLEKGVPILDSKNLLSEVPDYTEVLAEAISLLLPMGLILPYNDDTPPNDMWLICNGDPVPVDPNGRDYSEYIAKFHANTPNLVGKTLIGTGTGFAWGDQGANNKLIDITNLPPHRHKFGKAYREAHWNVSGLPLSNNAGQNLRSRGPAAPQAGTDIFGSVGSWHPYEADYLLRADFLDNSMSGEIVHPSADVGGPSVPVVAVNANGTPAAFNVMQSSYAINYIVKAV